MINDEIAEIFERMARVLAFKGENRFRVLAYERAAVVLQELKEDLTTIAQAGRLEEIPGIGKDLARMINEYISTGRISNCEKESRGVPDELIDLMSIPGMGPKTLSLLHEKFQIKKVEDLRLLLESGRLLKLRGFGQK